MPGLRYKSASDTGRGFFVAALDVSQCTLTGNTAAGAAAIRRLPTPPTVMVAPNLRHQAVTFASNVRTVS